MNTLDAIQAPQQCELLVAFSDFSAFKHCAQDQSEEQLFAAMAEYYELVGDIVAEGGGNIVKFIGDAALLVFPADAIDTGVLALRALKERGDEFFAPAAILVATWLKLISGGCVVVRSALATTSALTSSVTRSISPRC